MDKIKDSGSLAQGSIPCGFTTKTKGLTKSMVSPYYFEERDFVKFKLIHFVFDS